MTETEKIFQEWINSKDNPEIAQKILNNLAIIRTPSTSTIALCFEYVMGGFIVGYLREESKSKLFNEFDKLYEDELIIQLAKLR